MPYQRLQFPPGSRYGYSNPGYIYLARVIEKLTGDPWAVYVQKNIWTPLGMDRSYVGATPYHLAATARTATGSTGDSLADVGADFDPGITIPNGGWNAPVDDVARYLGVPHRLPADPRRARTRRARPPDARGDVDAGGARPAPRSPSSPRSGSASSPWSTSGRRIVGHTGDQAGYRSYVYFDPAASTGVILVFNTTNDGGAGDAEMAALAREATRGAAPLTARE